MNYTVKIFNTNSEVYIYSVEAISLEEAHHRALIQYKYGTENCDIKRVEVIEGTL